MNKIRKVLESMRIDSKVIESICSNYSDIKVLHEDLRKGQFECPYVYLFFEEHLEREIRKERQNEH